MAALIDKSGNMAYFGRVTWGNFLDWLVTLLLALTLLVTTLGFGGVRADTHAFILPLLLSALIFHGVWFVLEDRAVAKINYAPLLFAPFVGWMLVSSLFLSPLPWKGLEQSVYAIEFFIFFWVATNNARTRAQLWLLIIASVLPVILALYRAFSQYFQGVYKSGSTFTDLVVKVAPEYQGLAVGVFSDPAAFAIFLLILAPCFLFVGFVPRLPWIIRIFCCYIVGMMLLCVVLTREFWALYIIGVSAFLGPWLYLEKKARRFFWSIVMTLLVVSVIGGFWLLYPPFSGTLERHLSLEGDAMRLSLWAEAWGQALAQPLIGNGTGSFSALFEQSSRISMMNLPTTPSSDLLLFFAELGAVGVVLLVFPFFWMLKGVRGVWLGLPERVKVRNFIKKRGRKRPTMIHAQRMILGLGVVGFVPFVLCAMFVGVFEVPALVFYGGVMGSILVKTTFAGRLPLPASNSVHVLYLLFLSVFAGVVYFTVSPVLKAEALRYSAEQKFDLIVENRGHYSGGSTVLDSVIEQYETALGFYRFNGDALLGLSAVYCQLYYRNPSNYAEIGQSALEFAEEAVALSPNYWRAWAQVGICEALSGDLGSAEVSLARALEMAPNSSNANYYWASLLSVLPERNEEALSAVDRALEINPDNQAAQLLRQKLLIL